MISILWYKFIVASTEMSTFQSKFKFSKNDQKFTFCYFVKTSTFAVL